MVELDAFWSGACRADAGQVVQEVLRRPGAVACLSEAPERVAQACLAQLRPWQRRLWLEGPPLVTPYHALTLLDPRYPAGLRGVDDAPPVLFVEGSVERLAATADAVAVVGARRMVQATFTATTLLAHRLAQGGRVVVSGLALGVDAAAHEAALRAGGTTVAVLGHGLAYTSPRAHRGLRRRIVEQGGAVVSSFPDTLEAHRRTFPRRNRWIAALSELTCVLQAGERSGARITAVEAASLSRGLWVWEGPPDRAGHPAWAGCRALVADGAPPMPDPEVAAARLCGGDRVPCEPWLRKVFEGAPLHEVASLWGGRPAELVHELFRMELEGVVVRLSRGRYAPGRGLVWRRT